MWSHIARRVAVVGVALAAAACSGPPAGAALVDGRVQLRSGAAGPLDLQPGLVPFENGDAFEAVDGSGTVRIACGGELADSNAKEPRPDAGLADVTLAPGARFGRRSGPFFDLHHGAVDVDTGPMKSRVVVYRGLVFLEIQPTNKAGVAFRAVADGKRLSVSVSRGEVLVHAPGKTQGELHFVTLGPGESASAEPGKKPKKSFADD